MNVIDISGWQKGLDLSVLYSKNPDLGGVVVKASGGVSIYQSTFRPWADWMIKNNKPFGFYHFLNDDQKKSSGKKEADFFVAKTGDYFGKGVPCIDYEGEATNLGAKYVKECLDTVYALTGVKPMLYCSLGVTRQAGMKAIAEAGYPLWVAQYPDYSPVYGFNQNPWKRGEVTPWQKETMRQYTSQLYIPGWRSHLDADLFYGDESDWAKLAGHEPATSPAQKKSVDELAQEVIDGKWGNGDRRKAALTEAGYDYSAVQRRVNEILSAPKKTAEDINKVARDVIAGKYGNGITRQIKLAAKGYDYKAVQAEVNKILLGV